MITGNRCLRRLVALLIISFVQFGWAGAANAAGWTTNGPKIINPIGGQFVIAGINWYGFETKDSVAHGLWSKDYRFYLDRIKELGYNTVRIPFSNQVWETNPAPGPNSISACAECKGKRARDILALIVNYAGSIGLHVILDNHRSNSGNSAQENGLWYTSTYPESAWIRDWVSVQEWVHGIRQTLGATDTITVNYNASDGFPIVLGYDLRNEPHTPSRKSYLDGASWGTGDGIDPRVNPNPNPFSPACVSSSTCKDWRLAAERCADTILGEALRRGWDYPLIFVEGIGLYPAPSGTAAAGPYDGYWWGGNLLGVNGNANNAGAPIVLNAGGDATQLGPPVNNQLVYSAHDYGPSLFRQSWFNSGTCYRSGCSPSSLADVWKKFWAHLNVANGVNPVWPGHASYPWANTGHTGYTQAPMYIGEFGTGKANTDIYSSGAGSQGQWFTDMINFIQSSHNTTVGNDSGVRVSYLNWTYWAFNANDSYGLLGSNWSDLANTDKQFSFLCFIQQPPFTTPNCGSTGPLPNPQ